MALLTKDRIIITSKFFEILNHLEKDQLNELIPFFKSYNHKLNLDQKKDLWL